MKLGVLINHFGWVGASVEPGAKLAEISHATEEAGFDLLGVADHVWQHPYMGGPEADELECYATLAFVAANTERVRLMSVATGVCFRHPGMLAKTVTTLDVLSGGRVGLGIGAGHYEDEAIGLGIPFPPLKDRFEMLEETVQICLRMWGGDERPFEGKHYKLERPLNRPQSVARPPILIAGGGERKTLRLVARYADACNLYPTPGIPNKLDVLAHVVKSPGDTRVGIVPTNVRASNGSSRGFEETRPSRARGQGEKILLGRCTAVRRRFARRGSVHSGRTISGKKSAHSFPPRIYSAPGGLRQAPRVVPHNAGRSQNLWKWE